MRKQTANTACPRCGSRDTVRIVLGRPRPDLPRRGPRSGTVLDRLGGGGVDNPDRVCRKCGHQWRGA
jgi:DNA-directed RNA polymerase subunit RPC12/RpoP